MSNQHLVWLPNQGQNRRDFHVLREAHSVMEPQWETINVRLSRVNLDLPWGLRLERAGNEVFVSNVVPSSMAEQAGIAVGDRVLKAFDEDITDLARVVKRIESALAVALLLRRAGPPPTAWTATTLAGPAHNPPAPSPASRTHSPAKSPTRGILKNANHPRAHCQAPARPDHRGHVRPLEPVFPPDYHADNQFLLRVDSPVLRRNSGAKSPVRFPVDFDDLARSAQPWTDPARPAQRVPPGFKAYSDTLKPNSAERHGFGSNQWENNLKCEGDGFQGQRAERQVWDWSTQSQNGSWGQQLMRSQHEQHQQERLPLYRDHLQQNRGPPNGTEFVQRYEQRPQHHDQLPRYGEQPGQYRAQYHRPHRQQPPDYPHEQLQPEYVAQQQRHLRALQQTTVDGPAAQPSPSLEPGLIQVTVENPMRTYTPEFVNQQRLARAHSYSPTKRFIDALKPRDTIRTFYSPPPSSGIVRMRRARFSESPQKEPSDVFTTGFLRTAGSASARWRAPSNLSPSKGRVQVNGQLRDFAAFYPDDYTERREQQRLECVNNVNDWMRSSPQKSDYTTQSRPQDRNPPQQINASRRPSTSVNAARRYYDEPADGASTMQWSDGYVMGAPVYASHVRDALSLRDVERFNRGEFPSNFSVTYPERPSSRSPPRALRATNSQPLTQLAPTNFGRTSTNLDRASENFGRTSTNFGRTVTNFNAAATSPNGPSVNNNGPSMSPNGPSMNPNGPATSPSGLAMSVNAPNVSGPHTAKYHAPPAAPRGLEAQPNSTAQHYYDNAQLANPDGPSGFPSPRPAQLGNARRRMSPVAAVSPIQQNGRPFHSATRQLIAEQEAGRSPPRPVHQSQSLRAVAESVGQPLR